MAKREKSVEVTIDDQRLPSGEVQSIVKIGNQTVGHVAPEGEKLMAALVGGDTYRVKTLDEGIELLLREYHLHQGS